MSLLSCSSGSTRSFQARWWPYHCLANCVFSWVQFTHYMSVSSREEMMKSGHARDTNFKKQMTTVQSQGAEGRKVLWSWVTRAA